MVDDFFTSNRFFSSSQAKKAGYTKDVLKDMDGIVILGTFPLRQVNGKPIMEKLYTYSPELEQLIRHVKKIRKQSKTNIDEVQKLVSDIEARVSKILFGEQQQEGESSNASEESNEDSGK